MSSSSSSRSKRLMRELAELTRCPVPNIVCEPVSECLDEWHGNVRSATSGSGSGDWADVVVHFRVCFPATYPATPPRVILSSFIPHMNVVQRGEAGQWEVCLDMLEMQPTHSATLPYQYWSSSFSVRSLLVQLSSFLLAEDQPVENSVGNMTRAVQEAREFVCRKHGCCHSWGNVSPVFPALDVVESAPLTFPTVQVSSDEAQLLQARIFKRRLAQQEKLIKEAEIAAHQLKEMTMVEDDVEVKDSVNHQEVIKTMPVLPKPPVWQTVTGRGKRSFLAAQQSAQVTEPRHRSKFNDDIDINVDNLYTLLDKLSGNSTKLRCSMCSRNCKVLGGFTKSQLAKGDDRKCNSCLATKCVSALCIESPPETPIGMSAQAACISLSVGNKTPVDKNFARRERKRMRAKQQATTPSATPSPPSTISASLPDDSVALKLTDTLVLEEETGGEMEIETGEEVGWKRGWRSAGDAVALVTEANMGYFSLLSRDTALCVLEFLGVNDVLAFGTACRGTSDMIDEWVLWKRMLGRNFPRSALEPKGTLAATWKHAYLLEVNHLSSELRCFHSFATKEDGEVLTMPLEYTINPKTREMDYATSTFDVLSLSAFNDEKVRHTVWGEKFTTVLPYYIDESHFERSLKLLRKVTRDIMGPSAVSPREMAEWQEHQREVNQQSKFSHKSHYGSRGVRAVKAWAPTNEPEMIFTLIVRMMNTQVVLLSDKGIEASEVALTGYCQLHRLLLAVMDKYPQLQVLVRKRLDMFIRNPDSRVKSQTPSLGELMVYLSVGDKYSWSEVAMAYLFESFDRSVLWACTKDASLAEVKAGEVDRLDKYLKVQKVGMRLTLFHCVFLRLLVEGGGSQTKLEDCKDRYDTFQGRPPRHVRRQFHHCIKSVLAFETWPDFFANAGVPLPGKASLLSALEKAVGNSIRKGYHSHSTNFSAVMKNGVSKILLKGESYTAAPNVKHIQLLEKWRYDGHEVIFLDASCLVFDFHGKMVGAPVDYSNTHWDNDSCIRHSGDIVYDGTGQHTIDIDISRIPSTVKALYFTVSAWTTSLQAVAQPSCHLHDVDSDTEMCRYKHEGVDTGDKTAVIMCKLHRFSPSSRWEMTSIGQVGYGRAGNYSPIINDIKRML